MAHVLFSPLNWGLGHASRDIPIIRELLAHHHQVTIASSGNALEMLRKEFPQCRTIVYRDYPAPYSSSRFFLPKFSAYIPVMLKALVEEHRNLKHILSKDDYDLIISDNRLGVYSPTVPSFFITHQLRFSTPSFLWPVEMSTIYVNGYFHQKFTGVIVPDNPPGPNAISGKLSQSRFKATKERSYFAGILCSTPRLDISRDLDFLVIISGPEPQRTKLEEILLKDLTDLPGQKVVLLGSPNRDVHQRLDDHTMVHSYVSTQEKVQMMNRARFLISRSGYTTMMEVAELELRQGLFIPTPGQTEQEYLSRFYQKQGWFLSRSQYKLDLLRDVEAARGYKGFPKMPKTAQNVKRLYEELLAPYLE